MTLPARLKFGIFMAPFHPLGEDPTLGLERDLECCNGSTISASMRPGSVSTTVLAGKRSFT